MSATRAQGQVCPQTDPTSPTHWPSHAVEQQYESLAHTLATHASQLPVSFVPEEHLPCTHVEPPPPPVHDVPQIDPTSPTHCESHWLLQQYESAAQIFATQGSQVLVSFVPVAQV
jgi:hypothetical protein